MMGAAAIYGQAHAQAHIPVHARAYLRSEANTTEIKNQQGDFWYSKTSFGIFSPWMSPLCKFRNRAGDTPPFRAERALDFCHKNKKNKVIKKVIKKKKSFL